MGTLKNEIKELAAMQTMLRDQRKTKFNKLERTIEPGTASYKHEANREQLRLMYAAYGLLRGKTLKQVETDYDENDVNHFLNKNNQYISKIVLSHLSEFVRNEEVIRID